MRPERRKAAGPLAVFPRVIEATMTVMSDEEILAAAQAWASLGEHMEEQGGI